MLTVEMYVLTIMKGKQDHFDGILGYNRNDEID